MAQKIITLASEKTSQEILLLSKQIKEICETVEEIVGKIENGDFLGSDWGGRLTKMYELKTRVKSYIHVKGKGRIIRIGGIADAGTESELRVLTVDGCTNFHKDNGRGVQYANPVFYFSNEVVIQVFVVGSRKTGIMIQWQYEEGEITYTETI